MSLLGWLTVITVAAVVVVLATYLIAIVVALNGARKNLTRLAEGLAEVEANTRPLDEHMNAAADGLGALLEPLRTTDADLGDIAAALGLDHPKNGRKAG